jgi:hypothetical protein
MKESHRISSEIQHYLHTSGTLYRAGQDNFEETDPLGPEV